MIAQAIRRRTVVGLDYGQAGRAGLKGAVVGGLTAVGMGGVAGGFGAKLVAGVTVAGTTTGTMRMAENVANERPAAEGAGREGAIAALTIVGVGAISRSVTSGVAGVDAAATRMHYIPTPGPGPMAVGATAGGGVTLATEVGKTLAETQAPSVAPSSNPRPAPDDCRLMVDAKSC